MTELYARGQMRITGGEFGGRILAAPPDARVRPTADKVRQAIFNVLAHNDFGAGFSLEGARIADLFAGTGALGIEAISHGGRFCLFVDDSVESRALIRRNVEALELTGVTKIWRRDATQLGPMPAGSGGPFDLVFLDPPYRKDLVAGALNSLAEGGWLAPYAVLVIETEDDGDRSLPVRFKSVDERTYGETLVRFARPA
ncbi:MAG TPA: 16S rRNA (guanine(966)-N(2))-methyltransferase RsmD [Rhizomicrobium sp.]|nr:16S rRNA (guanine(966)-N(2))-methyltransferase RsmD [Rhizomicrobium sp.]